VREAAEFVALVRAHPDLAHEVGGREEAEVVRAEEALGVVFPPSYRLFVRELGMCEIAGEAFAGVLVRGSEPAVMYGVVRDTLDLRRLSGMPAGLLAFRADGMGGHFVLDTRETDADGEAPVRVWEAGAAQPDAELDVLGALGVPEALEYIGPDFGTVAVRLARRATENW